MHWFSLYRTYIGIISYHTRCTGFHYIGRTSVSSHITLCAVIFIISDVYRYHPISHSVKWFSLYQTYIGIIPYHTLCSSFHYIRRISVSTHITLCAVIFIISDVYRYHPISHSVQWFSLYQTYIVITPYHTLCSGFHYIRRISVSSHITLCALVFIISDVYRYHPISHSVQWFSI